MSHKYICNAIFFPASRDSYPDVDAASDVMLFATVSLSAFVSVQLRQLPSNGSAISTDSNLSAYSL